MPNFLGHVQRSRIQIFSHLRLLYCSSGPQKPQNKSSLNLISLIAKKGDNVILHLIRLLDFSLKIKDTLCRNMTIYVLIKVGKFQKSKIDLSPFLVINLSSWSKFLENML